MAKEELFPPKDEPLRQDVRELGALVGEVLRDQGGDELFERVEEARTTAIVRRQTSPGSAEHFAAEQKLTQLLEGLDVEAAEALVRSFSTYFRMVNLAEKVHRIRRRRHYLRFGAERVQRDSVEDTFARLRELLAGEVEREEEIESRLEELVRSLCIEPVFTAHPTEATRRAILLKEQSMARRLVERLDPSLTVPEAETVIERLRTDLTTVWQTLEHPAHRPTVADERDHVLFFVTDILYRVVPALYEDLEGQLPALAESKNAGLPAIVRFASWVGGDMDGNPNVDAGTLRATLERHRALILGLYRREVGGLAVHFSQSTERVGFDPRIESRILAYGESFPDIWDSTHRRHRDMLYRQFLNLVAARLEATAAGELGGYPSLAAFRADVQLVADSLIAHQGRHAGLVLVTRLLRRIDTFGFHLATLDVRQDGAVHQQALAQLLDDSEWPKRPVEERCKRLNSVIRGLLSERPDHSLAALAKPSGESRKTLEVFSAIRESRAIYGDAAIGPYIISMARDVDDVLSVLALDAIAQRIGEGGTSAQTRGEEGQLDVAPLFETVPDLEAAPGVLDRLFEDPLYRDHLRLRSDRQTVMVGYSDSSKDGGIAASRWALHKAQAAMVAATERAGVGLTVFHGRGGTIGRGGGKTHHAVLAAPRGSVQGALRVTEQGEVINNKFGLRGIALRNLERSLGAVLLATARSEGPVEETVWPELLETLATASRSRYRSLVWKHPDFVAYFRGATPIDVIETMPIGSRPASRRKGGGVDSLRAIPWVFSWMQSRHLLPGWFGLGSGIDAAIEKHGASVVIDSAQRWPFLQALLADAEMALAKADLEISRHYVELAPPSTHALFGLIEDEYRRTVDRVLELRKATRLLEADPTLARSIRLRNPYVDPMSLIQVDLLRRWREGGRTDEELRAGLLATVNGIAQGLRNTG